MATSGAAARGAHLYDPQSSSDARAGDGDRTHPAGWSDGARRFGPHEGGLRHECARLLGDGALSEHPGSCPDLARAAPRARSGHDPGCSLRGPSRGSRSRSWRRPPSCVPTDEGAVAQMSAQSRVGPVTVTDPGRPTARPTPGVEVRAARRRPRTSPRPRASGSACSRPLPVRGSSTPRAHDRMGRPSARQVRADEQVATGVDAEGDPLDASSGTEAGRPPTP